MCSSRMLGHIWLCGKALEHNPQLYSRALLMFCGSALFVWLAGGLGLRCSRGCINPRSSGLLFKSCEKSP